MKISNEATDILLVCITRTSSLCVLIFGNVFAKGDSHNAALPKYTFEGELYDRLQGGRECRDLPASRSVHA